MNGKKITDPLPSSPTVAWSKGVMEMKIEQKYAYLNIIIKLYEIQN